MSDITPVQLVFAVIALMFGVWLYRHLVWKRRERSIRQLLDGADALEKQLHECRSRMHALNAMVSALPDDLSATARSSLASDRHVQEGLRDVLAHRLWIQQHGAMASQAELDHANTALRNSSTKLAVQLERLAEAGRDLELACRTPRPSSDEESQASATASAASGDAQRRQNGHGYTLH